MFKMLEYNMQCTYWKKEEEAIKSIDNVCNK